MSFNDTQTAIEARFKDSWNDLAPVRWENLEFNTLEYEEYVALSSVEADGQQITTGSVNYIVRYAGQIVLQIFRKEGTGTGRTGELADAFGDIFRRAQFEFGDSGLISCQIPNKLPVGPSDGWYQTNIRVPYYRDIVQVS